MGAMNRSTIMRIAKPHYPIEKRALMAVTAE